MPRWTDDKPRPHHYEFAHRALPAILANPQVDLPGLLESGRLDRALEATWQSVGEQSAPADQLASDGLHSEAVDIAGHQAVLITFPTALHAAEAHFALVVSMPDTRRYLTLEFSWNVVTDHPTTVIGEWSTDGHANLGEGPDPYQQLFVQAIRERLKG